MFVSTPAGGVVFYPAAGIETEAIAAVQATVRRRLLGSGSVLSFVAAPEAVVQRSCPPWTTPERAGPPTVRDNIAFENPIPCP